jgi:hypothetical protein
VAKQPAHRKKLHVPISSEAKARLDWWCEHANQSMAQAVERIAAISEETMLVRLKAEEDRRHLMAGELQQRYLAGELPFDVAFPSKKRRTTPHPIMIAWESVEKVSVNLSVKAEAKAQLDRYATFMGVTIGSLIEKHAISNSEKLAKWQRQKAEAKKPQEPPGPPISALLGVEGN